MLQLALVSFQSTSTSVCSELRYPRTRRPAIDLRRLIGEALRLVHLIFIVASRDVGVTSHIAISNNAIAPSFGLTNAYARRYSRVTPPVGFPGVPSPEESKQCRRNSNSNSSAQCYLIALR